MLLTSLRLKDRPLVITTTSLKTRITLTKEATLKADKALYRKRQLAYLKCLSKSSSKTS